MRAITITSDRLIRNKLLLFIFLLACFAFFTLKPVFAEDASGSGEAVKKYKLVFPISELGNCNSLEECKAYCADVSHKEECVSFARKKGFYREPKKDTKPNFQKAKEVLGCDSYESCKAFCQQTINHDKCQQFARMVGLRGNTEKSGSESGKFMPNSQQAFEHANENARFCREHPDKCRNASGSGNFSTQTSRYGPNKKNGQNFQNFRPGNKQTGDNKEDGGNNDDNEKEVKGASSSPALFNWVFHFFFK